MIITTAPAIVTASQQLLDEYHEALRRGEEPHYPEVAAQILELWRQAEELTRRIEALGRKE